jgi:hypothetical protein
MGNTPGDDTPGRADKSTVCIHIPKALFDRVENFCASKNLSPEEFIFDAVSEKLTSVHRERRRKQRL